MNPNKIKSSSVFWIIGLFMALMLAQVVLYGNLMDDLKAGNTAINNLSRIRGSIQRYAKLTLTDSFKRTEIVENELDSLFLKTAGFFKGKGPEGLSPFYDLDNLLEEWETLKILADEYRSAPDKYTEGRLIEQSELCWEIADANVSHQQYFVSKTTAYSRYFTITFGANLFVIALVLLLYKKYIYNGMAASAVNDSLTGIFNKGYFDEYLEYEIARTKKKQRPFSLIMLDIDHFKLVNDTYGHNRGDYALTDLAAVVGKMKRNSDVLARVGGEEFMMILSDTELADAARIAERIRKAVDEHSFDEIGEMTVSLGVTEFTQGDDKNSILKRVDSALYRAKANGRNRCEIIGSEENNE